MSGATPRSPIRVIGHTLLALIVVSLNTALVAVHAAIGGIASSIAVAAMALRRIGVPPASAVAEWMRRVSDRAHDDRLAATTLIASAWASMTGGPPSVPPRQWLSHTMLGGSARLLSSPFAAVGAFGDALLSTQPTQRWAIRAGRFASRVVHRLFCAPGVLPGAVGDLAVARTQYGFFVMFSSGSSAVQQNFQGIVGGCLALLFGDPDWLADAMSRMRGYAEYVDEKERHGELAPRSQMPFSRAMVHDATAVVQTYPADVVEAMRARGFFEGGRAYWRDRARVNRMLALYFPFTLHTLLVVGRFFMRGLFDAPDAQRVTLCELAVMASPLPDDQKDAALLDVQETSPASIIEFEQYVPLVVPWDGTPADKAHRHSASGAPLDTHAVAPSIFDKHAVRVAQSTNAEGYALRTFLWLYRDETRARAAGERETARKFGPAVAARIGAEPLHPLESWEVSALTIGGPRSDAEVEAILSDALRSHGLAAVADRIEAARRSAPSGPQLASSSGIGR